MTNDYDGLKASCICAFDWYQNWMTVTLDDRERPKRTQTIPISSFIRRR